MKELITVDDVNKACKNKCVVLIYMDNCPYCVRFKPVFEKFSKICKLAIKTYSIERNSPGFSQISKMSPEGKIYMFPSILIFCKNNSSVASIQLSGSQTLQDLIKHSLDSCQPIY